jgi:ABC-type nitrate/sulfonate/bicarbonate transport system permease component
VVLALVAACVCGLLAGVAPALRAAKMPIVAGLRTVG